jgi:hypothetical protein
MIHLTVLNVPPPSWNTLYRQGHWTKRKLLAETWHAFVHAAWVGAKRPKLGNLGRSVNITVTGYYANNAYRIDADNVCAKVIIDGLKGRVIKDDDWKHVRYVTTASFLDAANPRTEITISLS